MAAADAVELVGIILAFVATNIGHLVSARSNRNRMMDAIEKQSTAADAAIDKALSVYAAKTDGKIDELARRVGAHNNVIERTYRVEEQVAVQAEQIRAANHRIDDLERGK